MNTKDDFYFWYFEAARQLCEMMELAFDFSDNHKERFEAAKQRFELAKARAAKIQREELSELGLL